MMLEEMLARIQDFWDDEEDSIDATYLIEDIERYLKTLIVESR